MKYLLITTILFNFIGGQAQTSNKKRVLVIPCSRFEFVSEFELSEIAEKNEVPENQVFVLYQKKLEEAFVAYGDENFEFVKADPHAMAPFKKFIKYKYGKFDGKQYNAVDLNTFSEADFTKLLEHHNTDFVIFITWYDIQKEAFTKGRKRIKRSQYAGHYIDFDIYNLFKQQVAGVGRVKAEAPEPNDLEASYKLLRMKELALAYKNFISKVIDELNKPIRQ